MSIFAVDVGTFEANISLGDTEISCTFKVLTDTTVAVGTGGMGSSAIGKDTVGAISIPSTVTFETVTYTVTTINAYAFQGCR